MIIKVRVIRGLRLALSILGGLLVVALLAMVLFFDAIGQYSLTRVQHAIPGNLTVGKFSPRLFGGKASRVRWTLEGFKDPYFEAESIDVRLSLVGLLRRDYPSAVRTVRVNNPGLRVVVDRSGYLNLLQLLSTTPDAQVFKIEDLTTTLTLENGWILYHDRRDAGFLYEVSDISGKLEFRKGEDLFLAVRGLPARDDNSKFLVVGQTSLTEPRVGFEVELENLALLPFAGHPGFGPGLTLVEGQMSLSGRVQGESESWASLLDDAFIFGQGKLTDGLLLTPWMPTSLKAMNGQVRLFGTRLSTDSFLGEAADIPFELDGWIELERGGSLKGNLRTERFTLARLKEFVAPEAQVEGVGWLSLQIEGRVSSPTVSGQMFLEDLEIEGQSIESASATFFAKDDLVHLSELRAQNEAGVITGQGWVFLGGEHPRVLLDFSGRNTHPDEVFPGLADQLDFDFKVLGSAEKFIVFGRGEVEGLGAWGHGIQDAGGRFLLSGMDLMLFDGVARAGSSLVRLPVGTYNLEDRTFDGVVVTEGFNLGDLPEVQGVDGQFSGRAMVSGDFSGDVPYLTAHGQLRNGRFSAQGQQVTGAYADAYFDGHQLYLPIVGAEFEGVRVLATGVIDPRNQSASFVGSTEMFDRTLLGLPPGQLRAMGSIQGQLSGGGGLGFYGYLEGPEGEGALSGVRRDDGTLLGVAWIDGQAHSEEYGDLSGSMTLVGSGTMDNLELDYTGRLGVPYLAEASPLDLFGSALLAGSSLTIRPTLLTANDAPSSGSSGPWIGYSGAAYPFFGPLLSGPLEQIIIEDPSFPTSRRLALAGTADFTSQQLDLRFGLKVSGIENFGSPILQEQTSDVELARPFSSGEAMQILSGYGEIVGAVKGSFQSPRVASQANFPWLLLGYGSQNRQALSLKGDINLLGETLQFAPLVISEIPHDPRLSLSYDSLTESLRLAHIRGRVDKNQNFDLRLRTAGLEADFLSFLTGMNFAGVTPYGRLATRNLHLWGTPDDPSLSGQVALEQGGMWVHGESFPLNQAHLDFVSQAGELRVEDLFAEGPTLRASGFGRLGRSGALNGELRATTYLRDLRRLGGISAGLDGEMDVFVRVKGQFPHQPHLELGLLGRELTWNPRVIGGRDRVVPIEQFALGHFSQDGSELVSGMTLSPDADGVFVNLPENGFRFGTGDEGLHLTGEGAVTLGWVGPSGSSLKELAKYFGSPNGPDFGHLGSPFRLRSENWTFREVSRLMGRGVPPFDLQVSGTLELEGQWWRDHKRTAGEALPKYALALEDLRVERGEVGHRSGFKLIDDGHLSYSRRGDAGFLDLKDFHLGFFREEPIPSEDETAEPRIELVERGSLDAEASLALTHLPESEPESSFHLGVVDIPIANLRFLLPESLDVGGLVEMVEVNLTGVLPKPKLVANAVVTDLWVGPLREMAFRGFLSGIDEGEGYRVTINSEDGQPTMLTFASRDPSTHKMDAEGYALLLWRDDLQPKSQPDPDRLNWFGKGQYVSLESPIELAGAILDRNLEVLAGLVPGREKTSGTFDANLKVTGTLERPAFDGRAELVNGLFDSERYGRFANLHIDSTVERITAEEAEPSPLFEQISSGFITRWVLDRFEGTLGGQPFFADGKAEFAGISPTFLNMFFVGEALPVTLPPIFSGRTDIELELSGRLVDVAGKRSLRPQLTGAFVVPSGSVRVPINPFGPAQEAPSLPASLPFDFDLEINLGQEFYVEALDSSVRVVGDLRVVSEERQPRIYGRTELSRGVIRIPFYEAAFRVRRGVAVFDGPLIPRLEGLEAIAEMGGYRLIAQVSGRYPDNLHVDLLSDPPLPQAELSRMVIMGGLPGQFGGGDPSRGGGLGPGQEMALLSGALTSRVTDEIGRFFLLSEISFDFIPPASYVIKLAKALDPHDRVLFTLTRVTRDNAFTENLFGIEWRLHQNLLTRIAFDEFARARFWFQSITRF